MSNNMDDLFANVKKMVDSGNIPPEIKQMMNNFQNSSSQNNVNENTNNTSSDLNNILNSVSPEMLNNLNSMMNSNNSNNNSSSTSNNFNIDMNTILKMKSIMENMNNKDDPRSNLLYSLKPYLRDSKKEKIDQYVNMLNITKLADIINKPNNNEKK